MILAVFGILLVLVLLITWAKIHPFIAFLMVSILASLLLGVNPGQIGASVQKGVGDILGPVFSVIILGSMLGKIIASSGAAQQISESLVTLFGQKNLAWALALTGFIVGIPLFYNVGFILLIPLIYSLGQRFQLPLVYLAVALCSSLSVTHGFLPPHPSPTAIVPMMNASLGQTLIFGLIASIPVIFLAGPLFAKSLRNIQGSPLASLKVKIFEKAEMPSTGISFFCALLPVVLLALGTWFTSIFEKNSPAFEISSLMADANIVMLLSLLLAYYFLGMRRGDSLGKVMQEGIESTKDVFPILMIIAGAGVLKEILISAGISTQIASIMKTSSFSPLVTGWFIAAVIRLSLGSATVAGLTAAGLIAQGFDPAVVNPNLMVLSIGAGSLMFSHVNDTGFWMFKEYFNLNIRDTIKSWSLMETIVSFAGLIMVLIMDIFV
ncbi:MAG TPA: gluconate:H+ symporter [Saprospiraceae bacterium]|nr:gluconate:H+ symporter [Saprospiraceae bacterium]HNT19656.1 gluconate:H+ symporter [Saprospiraceae bacterium]